jgi:hypothetical protein
LVANIEGNITGNVTGTVSDVSNHDTDDIAEGSSNLYYTDARADARVNLQTGANLDLSSKSTSDLSEGTNEYFTTARARSSISATGDIAYNSSTGVISFTASAAPVTSVNTLTGAVVLDSDDISEGSTNLYYTSARFDSGFSGKSTSDLSEGTNLYYTDARADARINLQTGANLDLSSKSTSDLSEGTNLYFTDARFDTRLATKDTDDISEGVSNLYYTDARANSAIDTRVDKAFVDALNVVAASATGNAGTATALATSRNFSISGDITASAVGFDGTGNVALSASIDANTVGITEINVTDGTNGQALVTDGAGNLSFSTVAVDQTLTIIGRSANIDIGITSGTLVVQGRAGNINIGV